MNIKRIPLFEGDKERLIRLGFDSENFERLEDGGVVSKDTKLLGKNSIDINSIVCTSTLKDVTIINSTIEASDIENATIETSNLSKSSVYDSSIDHSQVMKTDTDSDITHSRTNSTILRGSPITASTVEYAVIGYSKVEYSKIRMPATEIWNQDHINLFRDDSNDYSNADKEFINKGYLIYHGQDGVTMERGSWGVTPDAAILTKDSVKDNLNWDGEPGEWSETMQEAIKAKQEELTISADELKDLEDALQL